MNLSDLKSTLNSVLESKGHLLLPMDTAVLLMIINRCHASVMLQLENVMEDSRKRIQDVDNELKVTEELRTSFLNNTAELQKKEEQLSTLKEDVFQKQSKLSQLVSEITELEKKIQDLEVNIDILSNKKEGLLEDHQKKILVLRAHLEANSSIDMGVNFKDDLNNRAEEIEAHLRQYDEHLKKLIKNKQQNTSLSA
jgi:septal ring factor EnvC (AmiA/AmiB activator)